MSVDILRIIFCAKAGFDIVPPYKSTIIGDHRKSGRTYNVGGYPYRHTTIHLYMMSCRSTIICFNILRGVKKVKNQASNSINKIFENGKQFLEIFLSKYESCKLYK